MQYTPPNSDEAKKATFLYFMLLLVAVIAINAISVLNSGERMSYEGEAIHVAISGKRFDVANDIVDIYDANTSGSDEDYSLLMKNFDIEYHVHSVITSYTLDDSEQNEAYKLLYKITKKDIYKEKMEKLAPTARMKIQ